LESDEEENKKARRKAGLFLERAETSGLPSRVVGFRSASTRSHACCHIGRGEQFDVGETMFHVADYVSQYLELQASRLVQML
jgi:hypothetical protein